MARSRKRSFLLASWKAMVDDGSGGITCSALLTSTTRLKETRGKGEGVNSSRPVKMPHKFPKSRFLPNRA